MLPWHLSEPLSRTTSEGRRTQNRAADAIAKAQNIPAGQAKQQVAQYEQQYKDAVAQAKQQAIEAAQAAATTFSAGAILAFIALAIGGIAAWIGGAVGTTHVVRDEEIYVARQNPEFRCVDGGAFDAEGLRLDVENGRRSGGPT